MGASSCAAMGSIKYHPAVSLQNKLTALGQFGSPENVVRSATDEMTKHGAGDNYSMLFVQAGGSRKSNQKG